MRENQCTTLYDDAETKSMSASTLGRRAELFELRRGTETKEDSKQNDRAEEHNQKAYLKYTKLWCREIRILCTNRGWNERLRTAKAAGDRLTWKSRLCVSTIVLVTSAQPKETVSPLFASLRCSDCAS